MILNKFHRTFFKFNLTVLILKYIWNLFLSKFHVVEWNLCPDSCLLFLFAHLKSCLLFTTSFFNHVIIFNKLIQLLYCDFNQTKTNVLKSKLWIYLYICLSAVYYNFLIILNPIRKLYTIHRVLNCHNWGPVDHVKDLLLSH